MYFATQAGLNIPKAQCLSVVAEFLSSESDSEIIFRCLVAIGTLVGAIRYLCVHGKQVHNDPSTTEIANDLDMISLIRNHINSSVTKVAACAHDVLKLLQSD